MNDIFAYRVAQPVMFHQLMRMHGVLWNATQATKEPMDAQFIFEELMRINGKRAMPLLIPAAAEMAQKRGTHFSDLTEHCAWTDSSRAYAVQQQTPFTQRVAAMGRMEESIQQVRHTSTCQTLLNEHLARIEGTSTFEREPIVEEDE